IPSTSVQLHGSAGWTALGEVSGVVPAAPSQRVLLALPIAGGAYDGVRLGELWGRFVPMPAFNLHDQLGHAFDSRTTAGKDLVIAAFHTTCHQTCPLYTALFFQLQKELPPGVMLAEVTTDPGTDTPAVLDGYSKTIGASWTFA